MNYIDALCLSCREPFRQLSGAPQYCSRECLTERVYKMVDGSRDAAYEFGRPDSRLTAEEQQKLHGRGPTALDSPERLGEEG